MRGTFDPSRSSETSDTVVLFAKILLALGATSLLFVGDDTMLAMNGPQWSKSINPSPLGQACLGACFIASVILVAVWDCALAVLVCLFLVCWIAVQHRALRATSVGVSSDPSSASVSQRSALVSQIQAAAIMKQTAEENSLQFLHSVNTPLPTQNMQASTPMAFTMADRRYSTTCS